MDERLKSVLEHPENFLEIYKRQQAGELTLKETMTEVGVGRTRWYELAREENSRK